MKLSKYPSTQPPRYSSETEAQIRENSIWRFFSEKKNETVQKLLLEHKKHNMDDLLQLNFTIVIPVVLLCIFYFCAGTETFAKWFLSSNFERLTEAL